MKAFLPLLFLTLCAPKPPVDAGKGFAVVELFTSEGCSSCPPAERLLKKIAKEYADEPVYVLEFHVDYWDKYGWKDPFSQKEYTERQAKYTHSVKAQAYTPQAFINGQEEFVGSDSTAIRTAINKALKHVSGAQQPGCEISRAGQQITLNCHAEPLLSGNTLSAILVEKHQTNNVTAGENSGKTLMHVNIVRAVVKGSVKHSPTQLHLTLPAGLNPEDYEVFVVTSHPESLQITSAVRVEGK